MAKAARKAATPVKRAPRKKAAPQPKEPLWQKVVSYVPGLSLQSKLLIGGALVLAFIVVLNTCNSAGKVVREHKKDIAPHETRIKQLQDSLNYWADIAMHAKADAVEAEERASVAESQLENVMQDRNLSQRQQNEIRQTIKKQSDETTERINNSNSFADLDRLLDSLRRARKEGNFD